MSTAVNDVRYVALFTCDLPKLGEEIYVHFFHFQDEESELRRVP